jgi:low affinity Fe/Cu permease
MPSEAETPAPAHEGRSKGSRLLWGVDRWTGHALTAVSVLAGGLAWVFLSVAFGFPSLWERVFQTLVAAVTVVMVFVIQHTQARHQAATQRKLDEILRVLPDANNALLALEHASDQELQATRHEHQQIRESALEEHADRRGTLTDGNADRRTGGDRRTGCRSVS